MQSSRRRPPLSRIPTADVRELAEKELADAQRSAEAAARLVQTSQARLFKAQAVVDFLEGLRIPPEEEGPYIPVGKIIAYGDLDT